MTLRTLILALLVTSLATLRASEPPRIPLAEQTASYDCYAGRLAQAVEMPKEQGDALLKLLDGGRTVEAIKYSGPERVMQPWRLLISVVLTNGTIYRLRIAGDDDMLYLPEGFFVINEATQPKVKQWVAEVDADIRRGILSIPALPHIPVAGQAVSYKWRVEPVFQPRELSKERGDALLKLLDGGRVVEAIKYPSGIAVHISPPRLWISVILNDGVTYQFGIWSNGNLKLPEGHFAINDATRPKVKQWVSELDANLRREVLNAPRPCSYRIGTLDDGGTLSGVARIFYNDGNKWPVIFETNKAILKNPNLVPAGAVLTIP